MGSFCSIPRRLANRLIHHPDKPDGVFLFGTASSSQPSDSPCGQAVCRFNRKAVTDPGGLGGKPPNLSLFYIGDVASSRLSPPNRCHNGHCQRKDTSWQRFGGEVG